MAQAEGAALRIHEELLGLVGNSLCFSRENLRSSFLGTSQVECPIDGRGEIPGLGVRTALSGRRERTRVRGHLHARLRRIARLFNEIILFISPYGRTACVTYAAGVVLTKRSAQKDRSSLFRSESVNAVDASSPSTPQYPRPRAPLPAPRGQACSSLGCCRHRPP
jgi:hypothetical protein